MEGKKEKIRIKGGGRKNEEQQRKGERLGSKGDKENKNWAFFTYSFLLLLYQDHDSGCHHESKISMIMNSIQ